MAPRGKKKGRSGRKGRKKGRSGRADDARPAVPSTEGFDDSSVDPDDAIALDDDVEASDGALDDDVVFLEAGNPDEAEVEALETGDPDHGEVEAFEVGDPDDDGLEALEAGNPGDDDIEVFDLDASASGIPPLAELATLVEEDEVFDLAADAPGQDLGPTSTPEARDRLLAETLAHAEMSEARYRVPLYGRRTSRLKGTIALTLFVLAGIVAVAPPGIMRPDPAARLSGSDYDRGVRMALLLQAEQIEAFRARELRLPTSLDEVLSVPGVRFVRSSNRLYQLIAYNPRGEAVVWDSATPSEEFSGMSPVWRPEAGR